MYLLQIVLPHALFAFLNADSKVHSKQVQISTKVYSNPERVRLKIEYLIQICHILHSTPNVEKHQFQS